MRQTLQFESAWDQTIAPKDRDNIIKIFQNQSKRLKEGVHFSYLWKAENHRGEQLITVLIHNQTQSPLHLQNAIISYIEHGQTQATGHFDMPCVIHAYTTMPWTFIFNTKNVIRETPHFKITFNG